MGRGTKKLLAKESEFKMEKSLECQLPLAPMPCSTMQSGQPHRLATAQLPVAVTYSYLHQTTWRAKSFTIAMIHDNKQGTSYDKREEEEIPYLPGKLSALP
jgi:hypothetical protein